MDLDRTLKDFLGLEINEDQKNKFKSYYNYLIEYNKITNLTRITEEKEVYFKHFIDSLSIVKSIDLNGIDTICDMGSGAGFPSIPLKIMFPKLKITIVDSLNKRIVFLNKLSKILELNNVELVHDRVELYSKKNPNKFDLTTARALGNMSLISEMAIPMTKIDGLFLAMKATNYDEELKEAKNIIDELGCKILKINSFELPEGFGLRTHIILKKEKHIKGFPRNFSQMKKD